jgi:hypothetical protein
VFTEVTFWHSAESEFFTEVVSIPRNSEPLNSSEIRVFLCMEFSTLRGRPIGETHRRRHGEKETKGQRHSGETGEEKERKRQSERDRRKETEGNIFYYNVFRATRSKTTSLPAAFNQARRINTLDEFYLYEACKSVLHFIETIVLHCYVTRSSLRIRVKRIK